MDLKKIKKLIAMLESSQLSELEIKEGDHAVRLSRWTAQPAVAVAPPVSVPDPATAPVVDAPPAHDPALSVTSPMVGTFYTSPSPDAPPFVTPGQTVQAGDTVCIVEAMKTYNPIKIPKAGIIQSILVQNGEPVEFDQTLITFTPC